MLVFQCSLMVTITQVINLQLLKTPVFREYIMKYFREEVVNLQTALFVRMGKAVSDVLRVFIDEGVLEEKQCLLGFPHPLGANGHRKTDQEK